MKEPLPDLREDNPSIPMSVETLSSKQQLKILKIDIVILEQCMMIF